MIITAKQASKWKGRMLRFSYPSRHDDEPRCMVPRCIRVERVEEQDGSVVIGGHDFATGRDSTFYCESIEDLEGVDDCPRDSGYSIRLVEIEDTKAMEEVSRPSTFGEVQAWLDEWMSDPLPYGVVVVPPLEAA